MVEIGSPPPIGPFFEIAPLRRNYYTFYVRGFQAIRYPVIKTGPAVIFTYVLLRTQPYYFCQYQGVSEALVIYRCAFTMLEWSNPRRQSIYECIKLNVLSVGLGIISRLDLHCN